MKNSTDAARLWWANASRQTRNLASHAEKLLAGIDAGEPMPWDRGELASIHAGLENALSRLLSAIPAADTDEA